jgi:hypothetical protein
MTDNESEEKDILIDKIMRSYLETQWEDNQYVEGYISKCKDSNLNPKLMSSKFLIRMEQLYKNIFDAVNTCKAAENHTEKEMELEIFPILYYDEYHSFADEEIYLKMNWLQECLEEAAQFNNDVLKEILEDNVKE